MIDLKNITNQPGCYLYKDKNKKVIYVGKAKNLKKRVSSYFNKNESDLDPKTRALISNISSVDFIITNSEVEALILENNLIKEHKPKYNINLKDAKTYAYIKITKEDFPRLVVSRKKDGSGTFYGPFISGKERDFILEFLQKNFKIPTCKKFKKKPCLRYHINLCDAPCAENILKEEYLKKFKVIKEILSGKISPQIKILEKEMKDFANDKKFEQAIIIKKQIESLNYLLQRQNMEKDISFNEDVINYLVYENSVYLMVFNIYKGILKNRDEFKFDYKQDFLSEFILQYYTGQYNLNKNLPKEILIPEEIEDSLSEFFTNLSKTKVKIDCPKKGRKKELLELVKKNIENLKFSKLLRVLDLQKALSLAKTPKRIECFDISHLSGENTVASMVQFKEGVPFKKNYRKFKINTVEGIDDFASMEEVVFRRYSRLKKEKKEMPDLVIVDGGKGQLSSAMKIFEKLELNIPLISLAKRDEEVFIPNKNCPIILSKKSGALLLLQNIRDEAHRFAITYNRLLRSKNLINN